MYKKRNAATAALRTLLLTSLFTSLTAATFAATASAQVPASVSLPATPQVIVNRASVTFAGQPPVEQNGHLLVPLRGVLEKLGAYVDYNAATQTVVAFGNGTRIILPLGKTQATVNGSYVTLDVPATVINGSTMVPLRFVAESLGADVTFDVTTNTVAITTRAAAPAPDAPPRVDPDKARRDTDKARTDAEKARAESERRREDARRRAEERARQTPVDAGTTITGTVTAVYTDVQPQRIVVHHGSGDEQRTLALRPNAVVTVQSPGTPEQRIALDRITDGAAVAVLLESDNTVSAVTVTGSAPASAPVVPPVSGVFKGAFLNFVRQDRNNYTLRMTDGRQVTVPKNVPVYYYDQRINADDLRSGDQLTVAVDPRSHNGTRVIIAPQK